MKGDYTSVKRTAITKPKVGCQGKQAKQPAQILHAD
jgi:hypothetical protein